MFNKGKPEISIQYFLLVVLPYSLHSATFAVSEEIDAGTCSLNPLVCLYECCYLQINQVLYIRLLYVCWSQGCCWRLDGLACIHINPCIDLSLTLHCSNQTLYTETCLWSIFHPVRLTPGVEIRSAEHSCQSACALVCVCVIVCTQIMCSVSSCYLFISSRFLVARAYNQASSTQNVITCLTCCLWDFYTDTDRDRKIWGATLCQSGQMTMRVVTCDKTRGPENLSGTYRISE